jgi:hypothetical protein
MPRPWRRIIVGVLIVVIAFAGGVWATKWLWPDAADRRPKLIEVAPLAPVTRSSLIVMPAAIALTAIRDAMEREAPRDLSDKTDNPAAAPFASAAPFGSNGEIGWSVVRGPFALAGRSDGLTVTTALNGSLRVTGQFGLPEQLQDQLQDQFESFFGGSPGRPRTQNPRDRQNQRDRPSEQRADISGSVLLTARPALLPGWRLEPNLAAQVTIANASGSFMGRKFSLSDEMKPLVEHTISEQVAGFQARLRDDPFLEDEARQEWAKMCRSISLGEAAPGMPNLWLELRPTRAFAAQPRIDESALTLTFGVQAETRIVPSETKPDCPFPAQLELVPQMEQGQVKIAVPIDIPFTELNQLIETELKGKTFPEDKSSTFAITVQGVKMAASGDRLLISLRIKANENRSWFGFGTEATIHLWGRPVLNRGRQTVNINDIALDIQSEAAFGLLGAATRAALPYLERALAENAVVDLVPLAANVREAIEASIADFRESADGVRVDAAVTDLRVVGIEFDAKTLRVITEADGTLRIAVTALP